MHNAPICRQLYTAYSIAPPTLPSPSSDWVSEGWQHMSLPTNVGKQDIINVGSAVMMAMKVRRL